jgi:hypothetical protein
MSFCTTQHAAKLAAILATIWSADLYAI